MSFLKPLTMLPEGVKITPPPVFETFVYRALIAGPLSLPQVQTCPEMVPPLMFVKLTVTSPALLNTVMVPLPDCGAAPPEIEANIVIGLPTSATVQGLDG